MNAKNALQGMKNRARSLLLALSVLLAGTSASLAQVNIAQAPLFLTSSAEPNIMFILDDSGSMHWEITPDDAMIGIYVFPRAPGNYGGADYQNRVPSPRSEPAQSGNANERASAATMRSFHVNKTYYNPATTYRPWRKPAGMAIIATPAVVTAAESFPNATPTAAPNHPIRDTGVRDLTVDLTEAADWVFGSGINPVPGLVWATGGVGTHNQTYYPATYFQYDGVGAVFNRDSYQRVEIRAATPLYVGHGRGSRTDCAAAATATCTYAEEIQNFANWYTYYRSRMLSAQAGIGAAFVTQSEAMRVGFGSINQGTTAVDGVSTRTIKHGVRPFAGTNREDFFTELYRGIWPAAGTPLRRALDDAGIYFSRADNAGPWGAIPGTNNTTNHLSCRQSFTILMTDGYWNGDAASTAAARLNVDNSTGNLITATALVTGGPERSYTYNPAMPFMDARSDTLADVAMYYWNRDLRPGLDNRVPSSELNPAFWQHMVTYGVALGVSGTVSPTAAFSAITSTPPGTITWPDPNASNPAKIDDLLHAAVNSRGGFFSASDPDAFATELSGVLDSIVARATAAGTAAAASSAVLQSNSLLYNALFRSDDWSGNIVARALNVTTGQPASTLTWNAEALLASRPWQDTGEPSPRNLLTRTEAGTAVQLVYGNLGPSQQTALAVNPPGAPATAATAENRVNWLRGREDAGLRSRLVDGTLRRIGDIIGSDPQYVSKRDFGYSLLPGAEGTTYTTFRSSGDYRNRLDTLLVGSNNGFFHGFDARTGAELFAYMPSELLLPRGGTHAQINELMRPDYSHRYFVDGSASVGDAYIGGNWRTVAVGTMGAGGRTVFALNVTNPAAVDTASVLWEFTHPDLGFGVTKPKIVRMSNGTWAAVFGNGVNSATHRPRLFVVNLATGALIHNVDIIALAGAGGGSAGDPNGLSPVETTDWPANDLSLSTAYAGDLHGNLWRVNFRTATPTVTRLSRAVDSVGTRQPITARPRVALKPGSANDAAVVFGTGSFFRVDDSTTVSPQVQSLYGVFDSPTPAATTALRADLLLQTITSNTSTTSIGSTAFEPGSLRFVSNYALNTNHRGWVLNLPSPGERVISEATFPSGANQQRVRFTTLIPDDDPCRAGRNGFVMDIDLLSGGRYTSSVFDLSGDGVFDSADHVGGTPVSGIGGTTGETLTTIRDPNANRDNLYSGDGRKIGTGRNNAGPVGRQSWRQLR